MDPVVHLEVESKRERELKDILYNLLKDAHHLRHSGIDAMVDTVLQLVCYNPTLAPSIFNVLHFYLERLHDQPRAQANIVHAMGQAVLREAVRQLPPHFTSQVLDNIDLVSYACYKEPHHPHNNAARLHLHSWIHRWCGLRIVSDRFLPHLLKAERAWTFTTPPPNFPPRQEEAPIAFDQAMAGLSGRGIDRRCLNPGFMHQLVDKGKKEGVQDGWLHIDQNGHLRVRIEMALK